MFSRLPARSVSTLCSAAVLLLSLGLPGAQATTPTRPLVLVSQHHLLGATVTEEFLDNADRIDLLAPMWYAANDDGSVTPLPPLTQPIDTFVAAAHARDVQVLPIVRNFAPQPLLSDPAAIARSVDAMVELVETHAFDGLTVDFEHLKPASRQPLVDLLAALHPQLQARGKTLAVAVAAHAWEDEIDYAGVSEHSDLLYVMFYDYTGPWKKQPGPTAPLHWPENQRDIARDLAIILNKGVDPQKVLLGLATYGIDFTLSADGTEQTALETLYVDDLVLRIAATGATPQWDDIKQSPYADYTDAHGQTHRIWYEDTRSYQAKLDLLHDQQLRGVGIWAIRYASRPSASALWEILSPRKTALTPTCP